MLRVPNRGDAPRLLEQLEGDHHRMLSDPSRNRQVEVQLAWVHEELVTKRMLELAYLQ